MLVSRVEPDADRGDRDRFQRSANRAALAEWVAGRDGRCGTRAADSAPPLSRTEPGGRARVHHSLPLTNYSVLFFSLLVSHIDACYPSLLISLLLLGARRGVHLDSISCAFARDSCCDHRGTDSTDVQKTKNWILLMTILLSLLVIYFHLNFNYNTCISTRSFSILPTFCLLLFRHRNFLQIWIFLHIFSQSHIQN